MFARDAAPIASGVSRKGASVVQVEPASAAILAASITLQTREVSRMLASLYSEGGRYNTSLAVSKSTSYTTRSGCSFSISCTIGRCCLHVGHHGAVTSTRIDFPAACEAWKALASNGSPARASDGSATIAAIKRALRKFENMTGISPSDAETASRRCGSLGPQKGYLVVQKFGSVRQARVPV